MNTMTRDLESTVGVSLLMAFELGQRWWKVGFTTGSAPTDPPDRRWGDGRRADGSRAGENAVRIASGDAGDQLL